MKQLKTIVALVAGLFAFTSVQAGEVTVTGSMHATYQSESSGVTGNPLGLNTDLTFAGSTDTDFGTATWSMATDGTFLGGDAGQGADHSMALATGMGTLTVGNAGDSANAVDDITPTAFEEANGSGSGSYSEDFASGMDGSMSLKYGNADIMGSGIGINYSYYPNLDGTTNNEKAASGGGHGNDSAQSIAIKVGLGSVPVLGDTPLGGIALTLGAYESDAANSAFQNKEGGTVALVMPIGPLKVGYQKKAYAPISTTNAQKDFYKDDIIGIAYAINDSLALSYNIYESTQHNNDGVNDEQETKSINIAYTIGGLTLAYADAQTSNSGYVKDTDNDTRTVSIKTAF
jgi:hypothetical protein